MRTLRFKSTADIPSHLSVALGVEPHKRKKFGNVPTVIDGIRFDSKREASHYSILLIRKATRQIKGFARQVSVKLPSGRRLRIDFMVVELDGRVRFVDAKGYTTEAWAVKRDEARAAWGIEIETV